MDGGIWLEKYRDNPLTQEFYRLFSGQFVINIEGNELFYQTEDDPAFKTPEDETEYWDMVSNSVKKGVNLFLDMPEFRSFPY